MRRRIFVSLLLLFLAAVCLTGCAAAPRTDSAFQVRLAKPSPEPGWLRMDDPTDEWPLFVMPTAVLTAEDVAMAGVVKVDPPKGSKSKQARAALLCQISWWSNRRLKSAVKKHTKVTRSDDGQVFKRAPRLAFLLDGEIIGVVPIKGEIRSDPMLIPLPERFSLDDAQRLVSGITGEHSP